MERNEVVAGGWEICDSRQRGPGMAQDCKRSHLIMIVGCITLFAASSMVVADDAPTKVVRVNERASDGENETGASANTAIREPSTVGDVFPFPQGATVDRFEVSTAHSGKFKSPGTLPDIDTCRYDEKSVYCNTLSPSFWQPPGGNPNFWVADDISIAAVSGCELDRYVIMVTGNADGLGEGGFSVDAAIYPSCPSAYLSAGAITGTECHATFEDNGIKLLTCSVSPGVALPQNVFLGIKFSRLHCGIGMGAPASKGFSSDTFDFPGFACRANLGTYVPSHQWDSYSPHASFYAEIYTRDECPSAFVAYKASNHAALSYTPGGGIQFADDISLAVDDCNMVAYEVAVRGNGVTVFDLRTRLDDSDPINGGVIQDTRKFAIGDIGLVINHYDFDPPVPLPTTDLWFGFRTTSAVTGPVITGRPANLGTNEDRLWVHDSTRWQAGPLPDRRYAATDVTIFCEGPLPTGACCDMVLVENGYCVGGDNDGAPCTWDHECRNGACVGDSVCRDDLPEMNCPFTRWVEGESCNPDPFVPGCGLSACCTLNNTCLNLTEAECFDQPPVDVPRLRFFGLGKFCDDLDFDCPWVPCMSREGDCRFPRDEPGCEDPFCCTDVCDFDSFCCHVVWDDQCVFWAYERCPQPLPNDECAGTGLEGATLLDIPSGVMAFLNNATEKVTDYGFCCHEDVPGERGVGTAWYKFVGPEPANPEDEFTSVLIGTCQTDSADGRDSLLQVFAMADPDRGACENGALCSLSAQDCADGSPCINDDETACDSLIPIACSDDVPEGCGRPGLSSICVPNVVPGQTYYVLLAAKNEDNRDIYRLNIAKGCTTRFPIPNDLCSDAMQLERGDAEPLVIPFDLSGGEKYQPATFDCLMPPPLQISNMENDIWYDWVASCDSEVTIETCDPALPEPDQPNTTMVVYEGCDCPVQDAQVVAYSDWCGFGCGLSSCVRGLQVTAGQCYKIRLGGHLGGMPAGDLTISIDCPPCPIGPVTFLDPVDGTVDARQPHPPDDDSIFLGIDSLLVEAPTGAAIWGCWSLCETASTGVDNDIAEIMDNGDGTFTILLDRPLTPEAVTVITYTDADGVQTHGTFFTHPGNVDGNGFAEVTDVPAIINAISGVPAPYGMYSVDADHSGSLTAADILRVIDLLNGADAFSPGYRGTELPTHVGICP